ncbi:hypothetical protein DL93DRAFT_1358427 [Clavulina sp. PMI_390]|nr:hypothetical protein DL93DRAFT_1358427 [Clavulina sp. PMI_390]
MAWALRSIHNIKPLGDRSCANQVSSVNTPASASDISFGRKDCRPALAIRLTWCSKRGSRTQPKTPGRSLTLLACNCISVIIIISALPVDHPRFAHESDDQLIPIHHILFLVVGRSFGPASAMNTIQMRSSPMTTNCFRIRPPIANHDRHKQKIFTAETFCRTSCHARFSLSLGILNPGIDDPDIAHTLSIIHPSVVPGWENE